MYGYQCCVASGVLSVIPKLLFTTKDQPRLPTASKAVATHGKNRPTASKAVATHGKNRPTASKVVATHGKNRPTASKAVATHGKNRAQPVVGPGCRPTWMAVGRLRLQKAKLCTRFRETNKIGFIPKRQETNWASSVSLVA